MVWAVVKPLANSSASTTMAVLGEGREVVWNTECTAPGSDGRAVGVVLAIHSVVPGLANLSPSPAISTVGVVAAAVYMVLNMSIVVCSSGRGRRWRLWRYSHEPIKQ